MLLVESTARERVAIGYIAHHIVNDFHASSAQLEVHALRVLAEMIVSDTLPSVPVEYTVTSELIFPVVISRLEHSVEEVRRAAAEALDRILAKGLLASIYSSQLRAASEQGDAT